MTEAPVPLSGLKIVEFTHMVMGPTCGTILADLGADVVKVEPAPDGDNTRRLVGSGIGFYLCFNRNKRSLAVDLKSPEGLALVKKLIAGSDVVIENFRPGAMDRLGLGYAALSAENPRLVYCSCKGFLPGPYEHRVALDEVVQMMGGLAYMTGPVGQPLRAGSSVNDIMGGMFGVIAILAALRERESTGKGRHVQSALFENTALLMAQHMAQTTITGREPPPMSTRQPAWPVYDIFDTADGGQVFVGVVTDTQWRLFCAEFGLEDLANDPTLATQQQRTQSRERTLPPIAAVLKRVTKPELMATCERLGLPFAPIARPAELIDDPHLNSKGGMLHYTLEDGREMRLPSLPMAFDNRRLGMRMQPPKVGEHGAEIAAALGYSEDEIARMRASGAIAAP